MAVFCILLIILFSLKQQVVILYPIGVALEKTVEKKLLYETSVRSVIAIAQVQKTYTNCAKTIQSIE